MHGLDSNLSLLGNRGKHGLYSYLRPLGNRGTLGLKWASPGVVHIQNSRKGLSHDARSMSVHMGWANDGNWILFH